MSDCQGTILKRVYGQLGLSLYIIIQSNHHHAVYGFRSICIIFLQLMTFQHGIARTLMSDPEV